MSLETIPTKTPGEDSAGGIGTTKEDNLPDGVTLTAVERRSITTAVEFENLKGALIAVCEAVGEGGEGAAPGSVEARLNTLEDLVTEEVVSSPAALPGSQTNDLAVAADVTILRLTAASGATLGSIAASQVDGRRLLVINVDLTDEIALLHDTGGTAINRIYLPAQNGFALQTHGGSAQLRYDGTLQRWLMIGQSFTF